MKKCESCGMPMQQKSDFGGGKEDNRYCKFCTYPSGDLKPRHEIRENMVKFYMKMKRLDRPQAERYVDSYMSQMPAWQ
ncbi:AraC family transcriptional regulator [Candidatus Micrarchaeota archaeon]|nr:AraC family transcriptional regulator [Candidatus Micrarchaeota archaeon]